jgi:capsid protein
MAAIPFLKDLDDFHEAELIGKQVEACFGLIIKGGKNAVSPMEAAEGNATDVDAAGNRLEEIYPGGVQYMDEDGEITTVDPSRPGGNFAPFVEKSLRTAAAACGLPYEVMAKDFFRTTYSSGQLAMQDGKLGFDMRMQPTIDMAMRPLWRQLVSHAFFHGQMEGLGSRVSYLANRMIWERHNWGGDEFGAIDPMKQKKANEIGLATNQDTLAAISAAKNKDWRDVLRQRDDEKRYETELRIEREKRERELREAAGLPMPEDADDPAAADEAIEDGDEADNRELAESNS